MSEQNPSVSAPRLQLVAVRRIFAKVKLESVYYFIIKAEQMAMWDDSKNKFYIKPGELFSVMKRNVAVK